MLEEVEDFYTYYVQIMEVPEDIFWNANIYFLEQVLENKTAYNDWYSGGMQKEREKASGTK